MNFSKFLTEKKSNFSTLDEVITPEQRKQYNLVDSANDIVKKIKK